MVDLDRQEVQRAGGTVALTPQEVALLGALVRAEGRTVSREALPVDVWGFPKAVRTRAVDHAMARLRAKVECDPAQPRFLLGVRGVGYRLEREDAEVEGLVGRGADWRALVTHGGRAHRLTLVGPAGVGKTALLTRWAKHADVTVVPLEPVLADGVLGAVAGAWSIPLLADGDVARALGRALVARGVTQLALDAVEHVVDAVAGMLDAWAEVAPTLRVVVTGHGPLGVQGEVVQTLGPLDPERGADLLAARVAAVAPGVTVARPLLRALARRLDGLPLAIELIAGRARVVPPEDWMALAAEPAALWGEGKDPSLLAAVTRTWSWLEPELQTVLSAVSLYGRLPEVATLSQLVGADLVQVQQRLDALATRALWRMPEGPSSVVRAVAVAHAPPALVVAQARAVCRAPFDADARLAASARVLAHDAPLAIELLLSVVRRMLWAGPLRPGRADDAVAACGAAGHRVGEAHALRGAVRSITGQHAGAAEDFAVAVRDGEARGEALARWGWLEALMGQTDRAEARLLEALTVARDRHDVAVEAMVHVRWGGVRHFAGDARGALGHLETAVGLFDALGDRVQAARAQSSAGLMWLELGEPGPARAALEAALATDRAQGADAAVAQHLLNLGGVALWEGDADGARRWLDEAEALATAMGDPALAGQARVSMGLASLLAGAPMDALRQLHRARVVLDGADRPVLVALAWTWAALASARAGDGPEAERALQGALEQVPSGLPGVVQQAWEVCRAAVAGDPLPHGDVEASLVRMAHRAARER